MKLDSKFFDRIRVKPADAPRGDPAGPLCEWEGCDRPGGYRAPKGRHHEGQYFHFCLDHVRDYNKSYNYFAGMKADDIDAYQKASATGHRPTWQMGAKRGTREGASADSASHSSGWTRGFRDMFGFFGAAAAGTEREAEPERRPVRNLERRSFAALDLEGHEPKQEIKARFKALVKLHHPDANGGDRSSEDRLREIIQAYNHLKAAGFC